MKNNIFLNLNNTKMQNKLSSKINNVHLYSIFGVKLYKTGLLAIEA